MIILNNNTEWGKIDWNKIRQSVRKKQYRIFMAKINGNVQTVRKLQIRLINSLDAKLLSVLQVTTLNTGKKTAGVDKQVIVGSVQKMKLAKSLKLDGKAKPIRRVMIPKPGKIELRPLGIPTIMDRAKQNLAKLALEPEWEAVFEPNSYGFRPGRSCQDAIEAIFLNLRHNRVKHVYDAEIAKCFDKIDHNALLNKLNTFPQMEKQVRAWLKANIMEGFADRPKSVIESTAGTPQGGVISPLLANIALHGMENHLKEFASNLNTTTDTAYNSSGKAVKYKALGIIRYADDFVIIQENPEILKICITEAKNFLTGIGLEISESKSKIIDAREGFLFLGFQIILLHSKSRYKVKIMPSTKSSDRLMENIRTVVKRAKAWSAFKLISSLRPKILGWANYFRSSECTRTFTRLTNSIFGSIRAWVFRRDTRNGKVVVKQKYFPSGGTYKFNKTTHKDNWILVGKQRDKKGKIVQKFLPHISWVQSVKHVKVKGSNSPLDPRLKLYWFKRLAKNSTYPPSIKALLKSQNCKCGICGNNFNDSDQFEIDHIIPKVMGGSDQVENLQLIHKTCHIVKIRSDVENYKSSLDFKALQRLLAPKDSNESKISKSKHPPSIVHDIPTSEEIYGSEEF